VLGQALLVAEWTPGSWSRGSAGCSGGRRRWPPDPAALPAAGPRLLQTVDIALVATVRHAAAIPFGAAAARPRSAAATWPAVRAVAAFLRAIPDLLGAGFVAAVGLGPFAGCWR